MQQLPLEEADVVPKTLSSGEILTNHNNTLTKRALDREVMRREFVGIETD